MTFSGAGSVLRLVTAMRRRSVLAPLCALALSATPPARAAGLPPEAPGSESLQPPPGFTSSPAEGDRGAESGRQDGDAARGKSGPQTVFYRADDFAALHAMSLAASYAVESGDYLSETQKLFGIRHRVQAAFGVTRWLKLSAEQNMKNNGQTGELRVGVFAPQLRVTLLGMLPEPTEPWPLDVSAYAGPRLRVQGRREPSMVLGLGTNTPKGRFHLTVNQALELTRANPEKGVPSQMGPRYDLGVGYELGAGFVVIAEVWGHAAWSRGGYVEQEHHAGPSLVFNFGPARVSAGGATGWQDQAGTTIWDVRGMLTTGLEI